MIPDIENIEDYEGLGFNAIANIIADWMESEGL